MGKRSSFALLACIVLALAAVAAAADVEAWTLLGARRVTDRVEHDRIEVGANHGAFSAVQLRVSGVAVQFRSMTIHFSNGKRQEVELRAVIPAGGQSRVIDLAGEDRRIRAVDFRYDAQSLGRRATVRLFGRR